MGDPFTLVVSAAGLASFGIQLLQGLNKYAGSALDSRDRIRAISTDIELAVQVVQALDATIKDDANRALVNDDAERLAQEAQNQCWEIFTKIKDKLPKNSVSTGSRKRDIFTWPFKEPNLELLRGNLEKVKTTLQLLMNVIILAAMKKRQAEQALLDQQRQQIEKLLGQKAATEAKLEGLERDHAQALAARSCTPTPSGHAHVETSPVIGLAAVEQLQSLEVPLRDLAATTQDDPFHVPRSNNALISSPSINSDNRSSRRSRTSSESHPPEQPQGRAKSSPEPDNEDDLSRDDLELESLMTELHGDYTACIQQIKALQEKLEMALNGMFVAGANTATANPTMVGSNERRSFAREVDRSVWDTHNCLKQRIFGTSAHQKLIKQSLGHILRNWFVIKDGINRQVISADIQKYLGNDATVRPGKDKEVEGYWIKAYWNPTSEMINDLRVASAKWEQEQRSGRRGAYEDSHTYRQEFYRASINSPQLGEGYLPVNGHVPHVPQRMPVPEMAFYNDPRSVYGVPPHSAAPVTSGFGDPSMYASHPPRTPANGYGPPGDFYNGHPGYAHDAPPHQYPPIDPTYRCERPSAPPGSGRGAPRRRLAGDLKSTTKADTVVALSCLDPVDDLLRRWTHLYS